MTTPHTLLAPSLYEASLTKPRKNYPSLAQEEHCDVCIIGGGFTGLHTALNLQEQGLKVVLLEAKRIGHAASGRNGGHVIPEFGGSQRSFEAQLGMQDAKRIWHLSHGAADSLRERITRYEIACDYQKGHIEAAITPKHVANLKDWQTHIHKHYGYSSEFIEASDLHQHIGSKRYLAGLYDKNGGHLHPLKLALGLAEALENNGAKIYENSPVTTWHVEHNKVRVIAENGIVNCNHVVLGCNVGMNSLNNSTTEKISKRILPVATWVIATEPLDAELANTLLPSRAAVVDTRFILDYYRLSHDNRMVFGGGCSYTGKETPANLKKIMKAKMLKVFPQLADKKIEFGWGGLIDISMNRMPDFGYAEISSKKSNFADDSRRVLYAQGFSGSGIVATHAASKVLSNAILGNTEDLKLFQKIRHTPFPGGPFLRGPITAAGMLYHRLLDML